MATPSWPKRYKFEGGESHRSSKTSLRGPCLGINPPEPEFESLALSLEKTAIKSQRDPWIKLAKSDLTDMGFPYNFLRTRLGCGARLC